MDILQYTDIEPGKLRKAFDRVVEHLRAGDFRAADVKKLRPTAYYRAKLSEADRLLFRFGIHDGKTCILLLELIEHHAYNKPRFLNGSPVDESKLELLVSPDALPREDALPLTYINPRARHFQVLDKILSFDDAQQDAFRLHPPFILIGSAGSGKTVLTLEKLKQLPGEVLYVTHSPFLAENSRNLYYAFNYDNPRQETSFLSFREFLETLHVPEGKPMTYRDFERWFRGAPGPRANRQPGGDSLTRDSCQIFLVNKKHKKSGSIQQKRKKGSVLPSCFFRRIEEK